MISRLTPSQQGGLLLGIIAIFLPPIPVIIRKGCGADLLINLLLCLLAWIPGTQSYRTRAASDRLSTCLRDLSSSLSLTLSSFLTAFRQTHSSSSSINSDFRSSLQIGHDIGFASSPGGTTTNIDRNSVSRFAASAAATAFAFNRGPSARPLPFTSVPSCSQSCK